MKKYLFIVSLLVVGLVQAQDIAPTYEKDGDLVKATYYHTNGSVKQIGFFKNKMLTGTWTKFDQNGNKVAIAQYDAGKKVGKWLLWQDDTLREINYENNTIASVQSWKQDSKIAIK